MWSHSLPSDEERQQGDDTRSHSDITFLVGGSIITLSMLLAIAVYGSGSGQTELLRSSNTTAPIAQPEAQPADEITPPSSADEAISEDSMTESSIKTSLRVNGQPVDVPDNGTSHQILRSKGGDSTIDISADSHSSESGSSSSRLNIQVQSSSAPETNIERRSHVDTE